ncbi:MAG: sulfotransferase [Aureliella sp.]
MTNHPNFFIVGAPKCGTTTLYETLRQHPRVFMPFDKQNYWITKEPGYFCPELIARGNLAIDNLSSYLQLFADAQGEDRIGEASALYLFSKTAARSIAEFCPAAKIIVMIREPVAMMQAWHADNLRHGHDDVLSFQQAIELEPMRQQGQSIPAGSGYPLCLQYRAMASFSQQIERYLSVFGREQIKVILLEDMAAAPRATLNTVLEFLGLETGYPAELSVYNERVALTQGQWLKHRIKNRLRGFIMVRWARRWFPANFDKWLEIGLAPLLRQQSVSVPPRPAFLNKLRQEMANEVERVAALIDRDLSHWQSPANASM